MHAVGVPYRVPSSQDQDSLRVLQYVEKQLAHFNPARSTSHQCKIHETHPVALRSENLPFHADAIFKHRMLYCSCCWVCLLTFFSQHVSLHSSILPVECPVVQMCIVAPVHAYLSQRICFLAQTWTFYFSLLNPVVSLKWAFLFDCLNTQFIYSSIHFDISSLQPVRAELSSWGRNWLPPNVPERPEESSSSHPWPRPSA